MSFSHFECLSAHSENASCPLSAFPTFLLQLIKMVIPRRYSAIMFRYSTITSLALMAGEGVFFRGENNVLFVYFSCENIW